MKTNIPHCPLTSTDTPWMRARVSHVYTQGGREGRKEGKGEMGGRGRGRLSGDRGEGVGYQGKRKSEGLEVRGQGDSKPPPKLGGSLWPGGSCAQGFPAAGVRPCPIPTYPRMESRGSGWALASRRERGHCLSLPQAKGLHKNHCLEECTKIKIYKTEGGSPHSPRRSADTRI